MREKLNHRKHFSGLAMLLLLAAVSCVREAFDESLKPSDTVDVTLNIGLEDFGRATRAEDAEDNADNEFGPDLASGSQIDMLVYAVYYNASSDPDKPNWMAATEYADDKSPFDNVTVGYGQSIVDVEEKFKNEEFHTMTLTLKRGYDYRVVFWAQNHETQAFVIEDLKKVQMKYKITENTAGTEAGNEKILSVNNDEQRDAFCRYIALTADMVNSRDITVYLRRPLAQINVGTRGFDFETVTRNSDKKFLYSKVRINRAARYLNVVEDKIYVNTDDNKDNYNGDEDAEAFYTVDYDYHRIPAYWKMKEFVKDNPNYEYLTEGADGMPKRPSYTIYDYEDGGVGELKDMLTGVVPFDTDKEGWEEDFVNYYGREEFLSVHLFEQENGHGSNKPEDYTEEDTNGYYTYARLGLSGDESNNKQSEVFKYLSMSYVLVPTDQESTSGYLLNNFKMWLAASPEGDGEIEVINLNNVPVQRNRRTNIVGSLLTSTADIEVVVDQDFAGNKISGNTTVISGEISDGFYYNAENDEFEISSREGLLFFQRLVNGNMGVRQYTEANKNGVTALRDPYPYKDPVTGEEKQLVILPVTYEDLGKEKAKILLKGTKLEDYEGSNGNYTISVEGADRKSYDVRVQLDDEPRWPKENNFSFFGCTVRLMADIDLTDEEWIPIGFDCCSWDSSMGKKDQPCDANCQISETNYVSFMDVSDPTTVFLDHRRVFCGTFDGNNHTIYNLKTKRFGNEVLEYNKQSSGSGPYDSVPWFGRGFFGLCGPGVVIKNLNLQNIDIQGNNGVAGIVAVVNSPYFEAKIENCTVDMGSVTAVPLYRFDTKPEDKYYGRTHARGVYVSGIVGQFSAYGSKSGVTNCRVRNLEISGFRRMGAIIGSIADQGSDATGDNRMGDPRYQLDIKVEGNSVQNSLIVCNQYTPFNYVQNELGDASFYKNGFGWGAASSFSPMSSIIVGGRLDDTDKPWSAYVDGYTNESGITDVSFYDGDIPGKNDAFNVQYSILSVRPNETGGSTLREDSSVPANTIRESEVGNISLKWIPMFSSLFVDEVSLTDNYYGVSQIWTQIKFAEEAELWYDKTPRFIFPIEYPTGSSVNYDESAPPAGMYVETVYISGKGNTSSGGRSVITPTGVEGEYACVMYVTARDRVQFGGNIKDNGTPANPLNDDTVIENVVLRGDPYGWAGILFAPNRNMGSVTLDGVAIYDVYQTLALQEEENAADLGPQTLQNKTYWYDYTSENGIMTPKEEKAKIPLTVQNSNLRGYTIPGKGWDKITYENTVFEQGAETKYSNRNSNPIHLLFYPDEETGKTKEEILEEVKEIDKTKIGEIEEKLKADEKYSIARMQRFKVCRVDAPTDFKKCTFKAPFFIDLSHMDENYKVTFDEDCKATSTYNNVHIKFDGGDSVERKKDGKKVYFIEVYSDPRAGETVVRYYGMEDEPSDANYNVGYLIAEERE